MHPDRFVRTLVGAAACSLFLALPYVSASESVLNGAKVLYATDRVFAPRAGLILSPLPAVHFHRLDDPTSGESIKEADGGKPPLTQEEFFEQVAELASAPASTGVILYVHGCCVDLAMAKRSATELSEATHQPVVMYDWSTMRLNPLRVLGSADYMRNQVEAERSEDKFYDFLCALDRRVPSARITFIGFSKGCYIIHRAFLQRYKDFGGKVPADRRYKRVLLISADIDARTFAAQSQRDSANSQQTEVLVNNADSALSAASSIHGNEERLGAAKRTLHHVLQEKGVTVIDFNNSCAVVGVRMIHEMPFEIIEALHDGELSLKDSRYELLPDDVHENLKHLRLK